MGDQLGSHHLPLPPIGVGVGQRGFVFKPPQLTGVSMVTPGRPWSSVSEAGPASGLCLRGSATPWPPQGTGESRIALGRRSRLILLWFCDVGKHRSTRSLSLRTGYRPGSWIRCQCWCRPRPMGAWVAWIKPQVGQVDQSPPSGRRPVTPLPELVGHLGTEVAVGGQVDQDFHLVVHGPVPRGVSRQR